MDKRVIFAVAGSGKTSLIVNKLSLEKRALIITYTNGNIRNLKRKIIEKFGFFPNNITLLPYFTFLYSFCFKPLLSYKYKTNGVNFNKNINRFAKATNLDYYVDDFGRLFSNRIAKFLSIGATLEEINERIEKYFDEIYIDEIQDFAGNDFNFLKSLANLKLDILFVGDFFQHTYDTSRDGSVNKNLHKDFESYSKEFEKMGIEVDTKTLEKSWRCSPIICKYIRENLGIEIYSNLNNETDIIEFSSEEEVKKIFSGNNIIKVFYRSHQNYLCYSNNWGATKGEDHHSNVCVVLNDTTLKLYNKNKLREMAPSSKNKLYVAITRTRKTLYFIPEKILK